jgi:ribonuclease HI
LRAKWQDQLVWIKGVALREDLTPVKFRAYIDGAARGNPGPAGAGVFVEPERDRPALEFYEPLGATTNNVAEYRALLLALERAEEAGADDVDIRSDSRLLVEQLRGNFKIRAEHLKPLLAEAVLRAKRFRSFAITHIPRENNTRADRLANLGADASEKSKRF